jgi:hypothetical protein
MMTITAMMTMAARTERKTVAWYCDLLGVGRPAGLQSRHTDWPQGTTLPQRMHRSYESLTRWSLVQQTSK